MIVCVLLERFELAVAAGGRAGLLGAPAALAPEPGRELFIGEASPAAEAFGIHAGMRMGEALARCPRLTLVPPDPMGVAEEWERALTRLESIGAAVESLRPGEACFAADGMHRLLAEERGVIEATRKAMPGAKIGLGSTRFCAMVAAAGTRARRPARIGGVRDLADRPVELLRRRAEVAALVEPLERLGITTLGELGALPRAAVSDRFGRVGLLAHDLARGRDTPLRPRRPGELLRESLELPESGSGEQLGRALGLLIDRLLARRERRGRTLRAVVLSARLVEGGTWRDRVVFREALADAQRMRLALGARLALLPAPAEVLQLTVERFGPPHPEARALFDDGAARREARLHEAVRQARAAAGPHAALRVLEIDPDSRVPERRVVLTPFQSGE
ncbi:MAG: protein ImuB [Solirubrobacteraceae bacterium]|jgi:protein ImuB|nr:protein ImuB [Solirubrobacteraceae bacterium]